MNFTTLTNPHIYYLTQNGLNASSSSSFSSAWSLLVIFLQCKFVTNGCLWSYFSYYQIVCLSGKSVRIGRKFQYFSSKRSFFSKILLNFSIIWMLCYFLSILLSFLLISNKTTIVFFSNFMKSWNFNQKHSYSNYCNIPHDL